MKAYVVCRTCGTCVEKCDIHLHAEKCKQPKEYQATHTVVFVPREFSLSSFFGLLVLADWFKL